MYQPNPNHPSTQGYTSPPYRGSPIPQPGPGQYQGFASSISPPPPPNAFSPMSSGHSQAQAQAQAQRFQQPYTASPPHTGQYPRQSRYPGQGQGQGYGQPQQQRPPQGAPGPGQQQRYKGTLAPGTVVQVEEHQVRVERYLSEGGYAHVYLTKSEKAIYPPKKGDKWDKGFTQHCLKRIAFEDDSVWTDVKKEIEVMKALPPNPHLVQYLGSSHTRTSKGGHEVFILMEFCAGGGIIDLLNKRLRDRLKEAEILNIFTDVCEAVAAMHALKSPLLHRDLKIENVLSTPSPDQHSRSMGLIFKLCDFGSTTFPATHPPSSKVEADAQAMDLNRHTTLQYRSPEMVEPMLGLAVGLPSDVWALGVLLYKLCYYTTPFEEHGTLAIVNAKYTFPQYPLYSPRIQHLIASMLMEQPSRRPTVFDILRVSHEMSGTRPTIDYPASMSKQLPPQPRAHVQQRPTSSPNPNLLDFSSKSPPSNSFAALNPNIQPQRRGRPNRDSINSKQGPLPTPPSIPSPAPTVTAPRAQLQVTGDRSSPKPKAPTPSGSLDAFGMPTAPRPQGSTSSGFSDSFGANPNPNSNPKAFRPTSRFGRGLSNNSGFGDSFGSAPMKPTPSTSDVERVAPAQLEIPQSTSPTTTTQSSFKNGEDQEFESRYPSIETLSGSSATSNLISPLTSPPPLQSRPSMLGNMTGGDMKQPHQHLAVKTGGPQPRSTHVTGTAFARSPSPIKSRAEYFENQSGSQSQSNGNGNGAQNGNGKKKEVDLMTGEEDEQMGAPLIRRASSTFHQPSDLPPSRDGGRTPTSAGPQQPDSSDEDEGPESATAGPHEPIPSPNAYKLLEDESIPANEYKPLEESRSATLPPKDEMPSSTRSGSRSPQKQRPRTMYGYPSTSPTKLQTSSSPQKSTGGLPTPQPRPGHVRKGSINDIVSKFEGLNPPSNNSNKPKPVLKAKPAQLKKPTLDTVRAEGLQSPIIPTSATSASKGSIPPKPQKPISLNTTSRTTNSTSTKYNEPPKPDGYSRSSSGRSFPIVKPKPTFNNPTPTPTPTTIQESRGGSPDKQQSVNSLVARWNQGEINKKPVVKPKPVLP